MQDLDYYIKIKYLHALIKIALLDDVCHFGIAFLPFTEMAFKRIALAGCLLVAVKAYQTEETNPYQYYSQPTSEMVVGGDPGAALGALVLVSKKFQAKT